MRQWYVIRDGAEHGPFDKPRLKKLAEAGKLKPDDLVRCDDAETVNLAMDVDGIFSGVACFSPPVATSNRKRHPSPSSPLENPVVIVPSLVCCFPVGLWFVWRHSRWSIAQKWILTAVTLAFFLSLPAFGRSYVTNELADAEKLWNGNSKAAAVTKYRALIKDHLISIPEKSKPLVFGRIIDFEVEAGIGDSANFFVNAAASHGIIPDVASVKAKALISDRRESTAKQPSASQASSKPRNTKRKTRVFSNEQEFRGLVLGKTPEEVKTVLGKPDRVIPHGRFTNGRTYDEGWYYDERVEHVSGRLLEMQIFIDDGKVIETGVGNG